MKEYLKSTLLCLVCIFVSIALASVAAVIPMIVIFVNTSSLEIKGLSTAFIRTAASYIFIYITMSRNGYSYNKNYEKKSIKDLLIPIINSIILFTIINIAINFVFSNTVFGFTFILAKFLTDFNHWDLGSEYLFDFLYFLFPLSAMMLSITFAFFMFLGFVHGYKKREKVRKEITSTKND
jgi:hypothetical protein